MRSSSVDFGKSLLLVLMAWAITLLLWPYMRPPTVAIFYLAVGIASWRYGKVPGVFATLVSVLLVTYYFSPPLRSFKVDAASGVSLLVFLNIAMGLSYASASRKRALDKAENEQLRLEFAQSELIAKEQRWRALAESVPHLIWTCRPDGAVEYLSPQWRAYTGVVTGRQAGYRWLSAIHPDDREKVFEEWSKAVALRMVFEAVCRIRAVDGQYRWFKMKALPVAGESSGAMHWVGTCTDITDLRKLEGSTSVPRTQSNST